MTTSKEDTALDPTVEELDFEEQQIDMGSQAGHPALTEGDMASLQAAISLGGRELVEKTVGPEAAGMLDGMMSGNISGDVAVVQACNMYSEMLLSAADDPEATPDESYRRKMAAWHLAAIDVILGVSQA
jgi:hypothetical protein